MALVAWVTLAFVAPDLVTWVFLAPVGIVVHTLTGVAGATGDAPPLFNLPLVFQGRFHKPNLSSRFSAADFHQPIFSSQISAANFQQPILSSQISAAKSQQLLLDGVLIRRESAATF